MMRKDILCAIIGIVFFSMIVGSSNVFAQRQKRAQTGFQFLSVTPDARAGALGEAMTTLGGSSSCLFFNPAGMAGIPGLLDVNFSQNRFIADITNYALSLALKPLDGKYGVIGFSLMSVDYGEFLGTLRWDNPDGYTETGTFYPQALVFGFGYAKSLSDRFSVGGQIKIAHQYLGTSVIEEVDPKTDVVKGLRVVKNLANGLAYDFGTLFKTGIKSLAFGMSVRNFSEEIKFNHGEERFELPLEFTLGISMDLMDFVDKWQWQSLVMAIDATHPRDHLEQVKIGVDYKLMNLLSLRGGYIYNNDEDDITFGIGLSQFGLAFDYAYTPFGVFDNVQRFTIRLSL